MMRKNLRGPDDLKLMPSLLGGIFRRSISSNGHDSFDYAALVAASNADKLAAWAACRSHLGMYSNPDDRSAYAASSSSRQQYVAP
jgi:hypothetical protein